MCLSVVTSATFKTHPLKVPKFQPLHNQSLNAVWLTGRETDSALLVWVITRLFYFQRKYATFPAIKSAVPCFPPLDTNRHFIDNKCELTVWQKWWIVLSDQLSLFVQLDEYNPIIEVALSLVRGLNYRIPCHFEALWSEWIRGYVVNKN